MSAGEGRPTKLVVRRADSADLDAVCAIEQASFSTPWSRSLLTAELARKDKALYIAAEVVGELIGYVGLWHAAEEGHIATLAVDHHWRGRGVGEGLMLCAQQRAAELGAELMVLEYRTGNDAAARLYAKLGFIQVGRRPRYYRDTGEDAIVAMLGELQAPGADARRARARERWEQERDFELVIDL